MKNLSGLIYILSKFSFIPNDNEIFFSYQTIHCFDETIAPQATLIEGETVVDAYSVSNHKVPAYIKQREDLYTATKDYYNRKGMDVSRQALGSQDGEYVELKNGSLLYLLDPMAVQIWEETKEIEKFMKRYKQFLNEC